MALVATEISQMSLNKSLDKAMMECRETINTKSFKLNSKMASPSTIPESARAHKGIKLNWMPSTRAQ